MKILIKNGRTVTAVDDYKADILIEDGKVIRTGLMPNSTTGTVDKCIDALDAGLALC